MSTVLDRFLRYVSVDTQSQDGVTDRFPSTDRQKDLGRILVQELKDLELTGVSMDENGYVTAWLPANLPPQQAAAVPVVGFLAHLDTSPEVSGAGVTPVVHRRYAGGDLVLPGDPGQVLRPEENPELQRHIGDDIVTSDGTTLLGADNKAGIAEIMTMLSLLVDRPEIPHGRLAVGFTPDEEVGNGTKYFDVAGFGAAVAYTVDGGRVGCIEYENFNAYTAVITIEGVGVHPGYGKGKLVNAMKIAAFILKSLDADPAPETTEGREGFIHPFAVTGGAVHLEMKLLLRDFEMEGITVQKERIQRAADSAVKRYPGAEVRVTFSESYLNMKQRLAAQPEIVEYAIEAARRAGVTPERGIIRGGTDGARLSFAGLPTPNIFTGGNNFHSKLEWIAVQGMEATVRTLVELVKIWADPRISGRNGSDSSGLDR
ncbi:peptidase T [bacterium]|nr:peptidase T [bacterium]